MCARNINRPHALRAAALYVLIADHVQEVHDSRPGSPPPSLRVCYIFSAVLDYNIHLSNGTNRCYSTMTITPVKLDEKTSERSPCTRNELMDSELNITCRDLSQQDFSTLSSLKFKLAGKYKTI